MPPVSEDLGERRGGWRVVRGNAAFRRLWVARVISLLGDSLGLVALIILFANEGGDGTAVGLLLVAADGTATLVSPLLGVLVDRVERRKTMIVCELGQACAIGAIATLRPSLAGVLALVAIQSVLAATFQAASRGAVAELVDDSDLEAANAVLGAGTYGLEIAGPLLAALLLPVLSARGVLAVDVLTFLLSPLLLAGLPHLPRPVASPRAAPALLRDVGAGLRVLSSHRALAAVCLGFVLVVAFNGVDDVALVFLGQDTFGATDASTSLLYAGAGLGLLLGFAVLARRPAWAAPTVVAVWGLAASSAGNLLTGLAPAVTAAFAMQVLRGAGLSLVDVGTTTLVQRSVPRELHGRAFANLYGGVGLAAAVSYAVGGPLVDLLSPRAVLVLAGTGGVLTSAVVALALPRRTG